MSRLKPHTVTMNPQQTERFNLFLKVLTDTGNILHAIDESGWEDPQAASKEDKSIDLNKIPRDQWPNHICSTVTLPPSITHYIEINDQPLTKQERNSIGIALEAHYQTPPDYCIIDTNDGEFYLENQ
jgi:hypothetical protein